MSVMDLMEANTLAMQSHAANYAPALRQALLTLGCHSSGAVDAVAVVAAVVFLLLRAERRCLRCD